MTRSAPFVRILGFEVDGELHSGIVDWRPILSESVAVGMPLGVADVVVSIRSDPYAVCAHESLRGIGEAGIVEKRCGEWRDRVHESGVVPGAAVVLGPSGSHESRPASNSLLNRSISLGVRSCRKTTNPNVSKWLNFVRLASFLISSYDSRGKI